MLRLLIQILTLLGALAVGAGYLGAVHPAGDTLAVFRLPLAVSVLAGGVLLFVLRRRKQAIPVLLFALFALAPLLLPQGQAGAGGALGLSLYQKNMMFRMPDPAALGADILVRAPDFVTLQEVSGVNLAVLDSLGAAYPSRQFCPFATVGGVAVASRWPMVPGSRFCADHDGLAAMQVETPDGPVWVLSIHFYWPWPHGQAGQAARLLPTLARLDGPKAIGGDFNMVPWSHRMRQVQKVSKTSLIGPPHITLVRSGGWLRVPIDHVLVSGDGNTERLPLLGSDHYGLLAHFNLPRP